MSDESMVILGLGSNIGDRHGHLNAATDRLAALLRDMRRSQVMQSPALLPENAPPEWDMPYFNMVVSGWTSLPPKSLLDAVKIIERDVGRQMRGVWGPREIDIDILAMGDKIIEDSGLTIPHRELLNRAFALVPLAEIAPDWRYPAAGQYQGWRAAEILKDKGFA